MTHYNISYGHIEDRKERDAKAVKDVFEYVGDNQKLRDALILELGRCDGAGTAQAFQSLNFQLGFAGIQGYPVHALGRKYCLKSYRAWMADGDDPIQTDEEGFPIKEITDV